MATTLGDTTEAICEMLIPSPPVLPVFSASEAARCTCCTTTWPPVRPVRLATTAPARPLPKPSTTTPRPASTRSSTRCCFLGLGAGCCGALA